MFVNLTAKFYASSSNFFCSYGFGLSSEDESLSIFYRGVILISEEEFRSKTFSQDHARFFMSLFARGFQSLGIKRNSLFSSFSFYGNRYFQNLEGLFLSDFEYYENSYFSILSECFENIYLYPYGDGKIQKFCDFLSDFGFLELFAEDFFLLEEWSLGSYDFQQNLYLDFKEMSHLLKLSEYAPVVFKIPSTPFFQYEGAFYE